VDALVIPGFPAGRGLWPFDLEVLGMLSGNFKGDTDLSQRVHADPFQTAAFGAKATSSQRHSIGR
jgi:hypothetical protein